MVVEDDVTLVPTVETDRCMMYQDLEVTVKTWGRFYSVNGGHLIQTQQTCRENLDTASIFLYTKPDVQIAQQHTQMKSLHSLHYHQLRVQPIYITVECEKYLTTE